MEDSSESQLRMVSWSNYSHPTGIINLFMGSTFSQLGNQYDWKIVKVT